MASNIFYSKPFQTISQCDVTHPNFETDEGERRLIQLTQRVINHLSTSELGKGEGELLSQFIEKIEQIDERLMQSGRGLELKVNVHALQLLNRLRTGLDPSHQKIAQDKFVLFLGVIKDCELDDPLERMIQLIDFLDTQLYPALKNVQNRKELLALEALVDDSIELIERLKKEQTLHGTEENLEKYGSDLKGLWNVKHMQMEPIYQRLLTYRKGDLGNLSIPLTKAQSKETIELLVKNFKENINHPSLTQREKVSFFRAIQMIENEFAEHSIEVTWLIKKAFCSFLDDELLPAMNNAKSSDELRILASDIERIHKIAQNYNDPRINKRINKFTNAFQKKLTSLASESKSAKVKMPVTELPTSQQDRKTIVSLSKAIINLKPTIGDADAYSFSAAHRQYVDEAKSKNAALGMIAVGARLHSEKKRYSDSPEEILRLGQDLLRDKSGVCDHMAAAVIAKIVEHIRNGGEWNADVELVGNGAHAFIVINRPHGDINDLGQWKGATVVDTWLGALGVHPDYEKVIPSPQNGVISDPSQVEMFATFFGAWSGRMSVTKRFSAEELRALAKK